MRRIGAAICLTILLWFSPLPVLANDYVSPHFSLRDPTINGAILGQNTPVATSRTTPAASPAAAVNRPPLAVPLIILVSGSLVAAAFWALSRRPIHSG
jgi:hypothetical protein